MFQEGLFKGKVVLVTGGGSGIGKAISRQFLQYGAKVYIASRKLDRLEKAIEELQALGDCTFFELNIRNIESVEAAAQKIKAEAGKLDILINNAGGQFPSAAEMIANKGWNAVIDTNLNGTWNMTSVFANHFFIPQKQGTIVNIIANIIRGFPGMAHTGAARAGVDNLTKSLAVEWAPYHIKINCVAPGIIKSTGLDQYPPEFLKGIESRIPMKRLGSIDEVANVALFLSSPLSDYITGQTIYIDGGQSLWGNVWEVPDFEPKTSV
ncbi:MAG: SDR family oxidoreductase [Chitinophagales bacterium]|nr:SDR family oxidoreductase [Chitinophagales bacterium]